MRAGAKLVPSLGAAGLSLGAVVLGVVVALFARVMRPAREIDRYAAEVHTAAEGIVRNTDLAGELARTQELATAVPGLAAAYLDRLGRNRG